MREKRILFLEDDDFTSVATASLKFAREIMVVDIDYRIISNISNISKKLNLGIKLVERDLRRSISLCLRERFDVVFSDSPYTPNGIKLFVFRAIEALDKKIRRPESIFVMGIAIGLKSASCLFRKFLQIQV